MPIRAFETRLLPAPLGLDEAPAKFESMGICPAEVIGLVISGTDDERRGPHCGLSPSIMIPSTTCRREVAIKRFLPFVQDPLKLWAALSGQLWHGMLRKAPLPEGWEREVTYPGPQHEGKERVRRTEGGFLEYELWPGVWVSGTVDRRKGRTLIDFKTMRYSKADNQDKFGIPDSWTAQLNAYSFLIEDLTGERPDDLWVWRMYEGSYDLDRTFRKFKVPAVDRAAWELKTRPWCEEFVDMLSRVKAVWDEHGDDPMMVEDAVKDLPMDGEVKGIFNGKKCGEYCSCQKECWRLAGRGGIAY